MTPTPLLCEIKKLFCTSAPPDLGPEPRAGVWSMERVNATMNDACSRCSRPVPGREAMRALALMWHDHAEAAHAIVQTAEDIDSNYVHAILHRREPDFSNAKYWFRRVKQHAAIGELAVRVKEFLGARGEAKLAGLLIPNGRWDPLAFVDACEAVANSTDLLKADLLREIQQIEFEVLMEFLCREG